MGKCFGKHPIGSPKMRLEGEIMTYLRKQVIWPEIIEFELGLAWTGSRFGLF
jgi:hypothetical protein